MIVSGSEGVMSINGEYIYSSHGKLYTMSLVSTKNNTAFLYRITVTLYLFVHSGHLPAAILNIWNCSSINRISKISGEMWQKPSKNISHIKNPGWPCLTLVGILTRKLWYTLTSATITVSIYVLILYSLILKT